MAVLTACVTEVSALLEQLSHARASRYDSRLLSAFCFADPATARHARVSSLCKALETEPGTRIPNLLG